MQSTSTPQHETTDRDQANLNILDALVVKANLDEDKEVADCICAYKLNASLNAHTAAFKQFKKPVLLKALSFLNVTGIGWNKSLKPKIAHELI